MRIMVRMRNWILRRSTIPTRPHLAVAVTTGETPTPRVTPSSIAPIRLLHAAAANMSMRWGQTTGMTPRTVEGSQCLRKLGPAAVGFGIGNGLHSRQRHRLRRWKGSEYFNTSEHFEFNGESHIEAPVTVTWSSNLTFLMGTGVEGFWPLSLFYS